MANENEDAKPEAAPSSEAADAKPATPSSSAATEGTTQANETLASVVQQAAKQTESPSVDAKEGLVENLHKTEEQPKAAGETEEPEAKADGQQPPVEDDSKLPFHEHPRWKAVVGERAAYEQKVKELEPLAKDHQSVIEFCQAKGVTAQDYQQALEIAALLKSDPQAAYDKLAPVVDGLRALRGETLPKDLADELASVQTDLKDGIISEESAKRYESRLREVAKLRAQHTLSGEQSKVTEQQQRERAVGQAVQAVNEWQQAKQKADLDYRPKAKPDEPHGLFELVDREFQFLMNQAHQKGQNIVDPRIVVQLAEQAYASIKASTARFIPQPKAKKGLPSSNTSPNAHREPETLHEAIQMAAAKHGF
jgi:hypothetical protein